MLCWTRTTSLRSCSFRLCQCWRQHCCAVRSPRLSTSCAICSNAPESAFSLTKSSSLARLSLSLPPFTSARFSPLASKSPLKSTVSPLSFARKSGTSWACGSTNRSEEQKKRRRKEEEEGRMWDEIRKRRKKNKTDFSVFFFFFFFFFF